MHRAWFQSAKGWVFHADLLKFPCWKASLMPTWKDSCNLNINHLCPSTYIAVISVISCNPPTKHLGDYGNPPKIIWPLGRWWSISARHSLLWAEGRPMLWLPGWMSEAQDIHMYTYWVAEQSSARIRDVSCCSLCCFVEVCTSEDLINYRAQLCPAATWCIRETGTIWRCRPVWHTVWSYELFMHLVGWKGLKTRIAEI